MTSLQAAAPAAAAASTATEPSKPSRSWCFTINNPVRKILFPDGLPDGVKYVVYQLEVGESGTPHLQGYISLSKPQRRAWLQKLTGKDAGSGASFIVFDRAALFPAKRSAEENKAYCTKAEGKIDGPWELGTCSKGQGERTDLAAAAATLIQTGDIMKIDPVVFIKYPSGCMKLAAQAHPPRRDNLKVVSLIGTTGIGKSWAAHELYQDLYVVNFGNSGLWWDGYNGQDAVLFEEFKGQIPLGKMLQLLDIYPLRLEIKGGLVPAKYTTAIITSNFTPGLWYKNEDGSRDPELAALYRRLGKETPPATDKIRFIEATTRKELWAKIKIAQTFGVMPIKMPAPAPEAASSEVHPHSVTPRLDDDEQPPMLVDDEAPPALKRQTATVSIPDAPSVADMVTINGDPYVRDDIIAQWK